MSSLFDENLKTIFLSIGTSVIVLGIVSFLELLRAEQMDEKEKTNLKIIEEGGIENIFKRRDLEEYKEIVYNAKKSIDITGYSLRGFYESNKDIILEKCEKYKNFLVRIILVNPSSQFSENRDMEENEDGEVENELEPIIRGQQDGKKSVKNNKVVNIHTSASAKVTIKRPTSYEEVTGICDDLKNRRIVVVNTTGLEIRTAQRLFDFVSGCCYALSAEVEEIDKGVYLLAPSNIEVTSDLKSEVNSKILFNWSSK